jgi:hypothetical protein
VTRTAEEWGRVAVSLPGWRWMPGMLALPPKADRCQRDGQVMSGRLPDPDDPATAGCLLALLGPGVRVWMDGADGLWTVEVGGVRASMHLTLGRACIAAAEALGRWPGGGA